MKVWVPGIDGYFVLEDEPSFAPSSEATIHRFVNHPERLAKLFFDPASRQEKIFFMSQRRYLGGTGFRFSWPLWILKDHDDRFIGYVMAKVSGCEIHKLYTPLSREVTCPGFDRRYLVRSAINLAAAVEALHRIGVVIGDLSLRNVLVSGNAWVSVIDTDSFGFRTQTKVFQCRVTTPEYTPPELLINPQTPRTKSQDSFSLAILIWQLLLDGFHPFMGVGDEADIQSRIKHCLWPYSGNQARTRPSPIAPSLKTLPTEIQKLFIRTFEKGAKDPGERPSASEWKGVLLAEEKTLTQPGTSSLRVCLGMEETPRKRIPHLWLRKVPRIRFGGKEMKASLQAVFTFFVWLWRCR